MYKPIFGNFSRGFFLANNNLEIYLIGIGLSLFGILANILHGSLLGKVLQLLSFITLFFSFGYQVSIPLLLTFKQQGKSLDFNNVWSIVKRNTKRMILPVILFGILFMILFFGLFIGFVAISHPSGGQEIVTSIKNFTEGLRDWNPLFIIFGSIFAFFTFTPIYFSVENKGFLASMKRSVSFSFKHLNFMILLIVILSVNYTVITLIRFPIQNPLGLLAITVISQYTAFIISASTLLFYQSNNT